MEDSILNKLDNFTIEQIELFKANVEICLMKKIEEKKEKEYQEKKEKEEFCDPRDDEMMSEIYPEG